jgi:indole-3-acetate monooxygenase
MTEIVKRMLADIAKVAPQIQACATEMEEARRLTPDLIATLKNIGVFRMFVPRSHGGFELDLPAGLGIITALSKIEGSIGWNATVGGAGSILLPLLARETYDEIYRSGPDVMASGSLQPAGTAEAIEGGWRVTGRWPLASGCQYSDWIGGLCIVTENGKVVPGPAGADGPPTTRFFFLRAEEWRIEDTWHAMGLKATGSHHIALEDKFVPATHAFDLPASVPCVPGVLYSSFQVMMHLVLPAVTVGIAEGLVDDIMTLANRGRQQFRVLSSMRESETFQAELARASADLRAARALLQTQLASHWAHALAGTLKGEALSMESVQTAVWAAAACERAADTCFLLGGSAAVYESSPMQRRLRDLHTAIQHYGVHPRHYPEVGKQLLATAAAATGHIPELTSGNRARCLTSLTR